jgi:hypothetical protein
MVGDQFAVEATVLNEDFIRVRACHYDSGQIDPAALTFESLRISDRL